jgi:hypothetical protein
MADNEITKEVEKLAAFIEPPPEAAGRTLRSFSAASLILMRQTNNGLLVGSEKDIEFDVAAFLYAHTQDVRKVREVARAPDTWRAAVLDFAESLTVPDFVKAAGEIRAILERAMVGQDYVVEQDKTDPN